MSGYKRAMVSISQEEYDRLRDSEGKLRSLPQPSGESMQELRDQGIDLLRSNLEAVEKRQARYQDFLSGLDVSLQGIEQNTDRRLQEVESRVAVQVQEHIGELGTYFTGLLQEQQNQFEEYVLDLHLQEQSQISRLAGELNQLVADQHNREEVARTWLISCRNLLDFIRENYATGFFSPELYLDFEQQLEQIEVNYENGFYDAVLVASQQGFRALSQYRLDLERQHFEWNFLYQTALEVISQQIIRIENGSYVPALDLDGQELPYLVDVNYWNPGDLDALYAEISQIGDQLLDQENLPDTNTLKLWLESDLPACQSKLEQTIAEARMKTINSQLRVNVADLIVQALQQQGFSLTYSAYNECDLRMGYGATLTNIEGNEVLVRVTPGGAGVGENELHIESLDSELRTEHELNRRWQEVSKSLVSHGIEVGQVERLDSPRYRLPARWNSRERKSQRQDLKKVGLQNGN